MKCNLTSVDARCHFSGSVAVLRLTRLLGNAGTGVLHVIAGTGDGVAGTEGKKGEDENGCASLHDVSPMIVVHVIQNLFWC